MAKSMAGFIYTHRTTIPTFKIAPVATVIVTAKVAAKVTVKVTVIVMGKTKTKTKTLIRAEKDVCVCLKTG